MIPLRTKLRSASLAVLVAGLPWTAPAHAAALDADQIKRDIAAYLDQVGGSGKDRVILYRAVEVKPDGDGLRVAVDDIAVRAADEDPMQLGTVTFRLKGRDDGTFDVDDLTLPPELKLGKKDDVTTLKLPSVALTGRWAPKLQTFLALDAGLKNVTVADKRSLGSVDQIAVKLATADKGGGRYDETGSLVIDGVKVADDEKHSVALGQLAISSSVDNADLAAWAEQQAKMRALEGGGKPPAEADLLGMLGGMLGLLPNGKGSLRLTKLAVADGTEGWSFALPTASLGGGISGIDQERAAIGLDLAYGGLTYSTGNQQEDAMTSGLAPRRLSLSLALEDLPSKQLVAMLGGFLQSSAASAAAGAAGGNSSGETSAKSDGSAAEAAPAMDPSMAAMMLLPQLQTSLQQAGSKFRIAPSEIESQIAKIKLEGLAQATPQSALGGIAVLKMEITGLDRIIASAKQVLGPEGGDEAKALDVLRLVSERSKAADGTPIDRYTFSLSPEGEMKVNDKPIDSLFQ
jgi:hypothetical protein